MKFISVVLVSFFSLNAFSGMAEDFDRIKNLGRNLEPTGAICEEVAQLRFSEKYPEPEYRVVTGVEYSDRDGTLGELDVVVFNNQNNTAEVVAEVKCWSNPKSGLKKAKEQRQRFIINVQSPKALKFKWLNDPKLPLVKTQFNKVRQFYFVAQSGSLDNGFDYELPYTLSELMQLRKDILDCQARNECKK